MRRTAGCNNRSFVLGSRMKGGRNSRLFDCGGKAASAQDDSEESAPDQAKRAIPYGTAQW